MLIKNEIYPSRILTIPDDVAIFSVLDSKTEISKKIIIENYIDFYCFQDLTYDYKVFRFRDFMDHENIAGIHRCFIPMEVLKKYHTDLEIVIQLLVEGYIILMPMMRESFRFYGNDKGDHKALLYGADLKRKIFLCKDFRGHDFIEFEATFDEMKNSLVRYFRPAPREQDGLWAFRLNITNSSKIDYTKVYSEYLSLGQEFYTPKDGYGIGAINLYIDDLRNRPYDYILKHWWYELTNFLREASKLTNERYQILKADCEKKKAGDWSAGDQLVRNLAHDTNILFLGICKIQIKGMASEEITDNYIRLLNTCRDDYKYISEYFCETIAGLEFW